MLHFNGLPVYIGQKISVETKGTGKTSRLIWAVKMTGPSGVRVLHSSGDPSMFGIEP